MEDTERQARIAAHWDRMTRGKRVRWWHSRVITEEINQRVCGERLPRLSEGLARLAIAANDGKPFRRGVSVGCGVGSKELALLEAGLVEHFTMYELSAERVARAIQAAQKRRLADRVDVVQGDAFEAGVADGTFDLVHWNNSLHHMFDTEAAVAWSHRVLADDGLFYMDDFVGPNRFQWSDAGLKLASRVRAALPEALRHRAGDGDVLPTRVGRAWAARRRRPLERGQDRGGGPVGGT